jgi:hypothetical protein
MLGDRNSFAHVYDGTALNQLVNRVLEEYIPVFCALELAVVDCYGNELDSIA